MHEIEPIPVKPRPFRQEFDSLEGAVEHALSHPRRPEVEADSAKIKDTTLVDAYWSLSEFVLQFSNDHWLHISISNKAPTWRLLTAAPSLAIQSPCRVGADPVYLDWQRHIGIVPMDVSELVAKRLGSTLTNLFINDTGFFVYFRGHLVFEFNAAFRADTGEDILYVIEEE